jgi:hypothetical protein
MYSQLYNDNNYQFNRFLSRELQNKGKINKKHSDSLNCLVNCSEFRATLHITQKTGNGKDNIYFVQKGDKFSPLFFYDIPSNKIIDEMQIKNEAEKLLNKNQKIQSENEIIDKYEQIKKNKMLLFKYIKFPLININSENNEKKLSTIIILDNGENDIISNFSTNSSYVYHQTCSICLVIRNIQCDYLFSLSDIKDCQEIKIRLNGTVHEEALFDKEIICYISSELIINSINKRMEKYFNFDNIENLIGKYFFTKLNDSNSNNIGLLFSLKKKSETSQLKYDKDYLKTDRYLINKIFFFIDMWLNDNYNNKNINSNNYNSFSSTNSSSQMIFNFKYDNNIFNKYAFNFKSSGNDYNYPNYYNNENNAYRENYITNSKEKEESNSNIIYNDINRIYINNRNKLEKENTITETSNNIYNDYNKYNYSINDDYINPDYSSYNNYYNRKETDLNYIFNLISKNEEINAYRERQIFLNLDDINSSLLYEQEHENKINSENESSKNNYYDTIETKSQIEQNIFQNKTLFINMNEELMRKLFEKYEQDKCISNYTIIRNMLEINMSSIFKDEKWLLKTTLINFLDIFNNANMLFLNIPFITLKSQLYINCLSPSLSSMHLVIKKNKEIKKELKNIKMRCKKYKEFIYETFEKNKKLFKIEFEEIKPPHRRELLYKKVTKIKKIFGDTKIKFKNILVKNSYFSILWTITNNISIKTSFLAYYSFDFKLVGILMINLNYNHWLTPFSYDLKNYRDYKIDYDKNVETVKKMFQNLPIDQDDQHSDNFFKYDYYNFLNSNKIKNY